jgi:hypothetical protein
MRSQSYADLSFFFSESKSDKNLIIDVFISLFTSVTFLEKARRETERRNF